jgi:hypothetical protein
MIVDQHIYLLTNELLWSRLAEIFRGQRSPAERAVNRAVEGDGSGTPATATRKPL